MNLLSRIEKGRRASQRELPSIHRAVSRAIGGVAFVCGVCVSAAAFADSVILPIVEVGTVANESGEGKLLVRTMPWTPSPGTSILSATFLFSMLGTDDTGGDSDSVALSKDATIPEDEEPAIPSLATLDVYRVSRPWSSADLLWTDWDEAGDGVTDGEFSRTELVQPQGGAGETAIDVTDLFRQLPEAGGLDHGYLVAVAPAEGAGIDSSTLLLLDQLPAGHLLVKYKNLRLPPQVR